MQNDRDAEVLNSIYRGARTGCRAIADLLPKCENTKFRADLQTQSKEYSSIAEEASSKLVSMGLEAQDVPLTQKVGMKMAVAVNTAANDDTCHLAELVIKGSTTGISNMTKVLNRYASPDKAVADLANRLIESEQNNIERLKSYL